MAPQRAPRLEVVEPDAWQSTPVAFSRIFLSRDGTPIAAGHSDEGIFRFDPQQKAWLPLRALEAPENVWAGRQGIVVLDAVGVGPSFVVKWFDFQGSLLRSFPLQGNPGYVAGLAVDEEGLVYVNDPSDEKGIISVYGPTGSLLRRFADPLPAPGREEQVLLNQAWIALGGDGSVLVAFRFEPRLLIYRRTGALLADVTLEHPVVDRRREEERDEIPERFGVDDKGRVILRAFVYWTTAAALPGGGYVLGFGDGSFVFFVNRAGRLEKIWRVTDGQNPFTTFDYWDANIEIVGNRLAMGAGSALARRPGKIAYFRLDGGGPTK